MCIRDSLPAGRVRLRQIHSPARGGGAYPCLLYTSDAADELDGVDLGGRRIIKKKFFQAEDGILDVAPSRGLGDVYKRQALKAAHSPLPYSLPGTLNHA